MSDLLKRKGSQLPETHNTMTLGTCSGDIPGGYGLYASDDFAPLFFSVPDSRHCQNLAANPRVAVTIQEDYHDWQKIKGIQLEGTATLVDSIIEKAKAHGGLRAQVSRRSLSFHESGERPLYEGFSEGQILSVSSSKSFFSSIMNRVLANGRSCHSRVDRISRRNV